jgi:hypothetical protein
MDYNSAPLTGNSLPASPVGTYQNNIYFVNEWGNGGIVFEKIGAACRMEFVSMSNTLQLFFNAEGDEFQTWRPSTGEFSPPYVIN